MFAPDVVSLRQFYASPLGEAVRRHVDNSLKRLWPELNGDTLLGIGHAMPYVESYLGQNASVFVAMPATQGAVYWPSNRTNLVFLTHEPELPLQENSVNRVLLIHSLENSEHRSWMMREIWRVLTPGGRVLAVVPNRMGIWSRSSKSPFGYGHPFSMAQLRDLVSEHNFTVTRSTSALFNPPMRMPLTWRVAPKIEAIGRTFFPFFGGVLFVEAEKQIYSTIRQPVTTKPAFRTPVAATNPVMGRL